MTKNEFGDRQHGDLEGKLHLPASPARVTLRAPDLIARSRTGQQLLWMLTNLLSRQAEEIGQICWDVTPELPLLSGLSPLLPGNGTLVDALHAAALRINPHLAGVSSPAADIVIQVGPLPAPAGYSHTLYASATSWSGYTGTQPAVWAPSDENPVGAYTAACLTAGEVFKILRRVRPDAGTQASAFWFDAYHFQARDPAVPEVLLPSSIHGLPAVLAGVGAVGSAALHTLYAIPGLTATLTAIDNDPDGIDITNLNRYTLFDRQDLGAPKAERAALRFAGSGVRLEPRDQSWASWAAQTPEGRPELVLSCVDNNRARHAIQDALPGVILSASTQDMRAQLIAYERTPGTACLKCRNAPEHEVADDEIIATLRESGPAERAILASRQGIGPDILETYLLDPQAHCGLISSETLHNFDAGATPQSAWSVGFVSTLAGVLLAAEYVRRSAGDKESRLTGQHNMALVQFWNLASSVNSRRHWPPAPSCGCQRDTYQQAVRAHPYTG